MLTSERNRIIGLDKNRATETNGRFGIRRQSLNGRKREAHTRCCGESNEGSSSHFHACKINSSR